MTLRSAGPSRRDAAWALVLALAIAGTWCVSYGRTSRQAWATPVTYRGDALFLMAYLRAAGQGHVLPAASLEVPELNAPSTANWNDHPRTLRIVFLAAGLVSRVSGLFVAANALLLTAHVLAGLSFFFVARRFAARPEWAAAGGLAFGLSHFLFWRSLDHLDLALGWHIPLCILVATWAASGAGVPPGSRRFVVAVAVCGVTALHNPYYSCLFAQFLLLAALAQALRPRGRVLDPLLLLGVLVGAFLADNAGSLAYAWSHGANAAATRPYGNLERFALKPLELFFPPPGYGLGDWGRVARAYWEGRIYRGEGGSPYLGLLGAGALAWLAAVSVTRLLRRPAQAPPAAAAAIAWIVAFSMLGGGNQFVGMFGFLWLRGTNRFSVWILALALLFLVTRRLPRGRAGRALAAGVALLAVADQVPRPANRDEIARTARLIAADATFVASIERVLPPRAMLFMMPLIEFPEGRPVLGVGEYEHLRPYLHSRTLRYSYGGDKGRPRESWQLDVAALPVPRMLDALEDCGFEGILLNRRGYPAAGADLLGQMHAAGRYVTAADTNGDYALVRLSPSPRAAGHGPEARAARCGVPAVADRADR
jgi:hypothetical protein